MDILFTFLLVWAFRNVWRDVTGKLRESRTERVNAALEKMPPGQGMSKGQRMRMAARHDTGWWAREILGGFPVTRSGWHNGWLAHKTAAVHQKAIRAETRRTHQDVQESLRAAVKREARQILHPAENEKDPEPQSPALLHVVRDGENETPVPVPVPAATRPSTPEPAAAGSGGLPAVAAPPSTRPSPPPGPYAPSAPAPTNGAPVAVAEETYDQIVRQCDQEVAEGEARLATLRGKQLGNMADRLANVLRDGPTLGSLADWDDAVQQEMKAVQAQIDHASAVKSGLQRNHGGMNQAHQDAPVAGADPTFYEG